VLIGDRDRELATAALRRHFAHGRLSLAELSERVDLTLRARSRSDLNRALRDLPLTWEELPAIVQTTARKLQRGIRRTRLLFVLVRVWWKLSLALALACGVALIAGAPATTVLGGFLIAWALAGLATWHAWRRAGSRL
jgi:uncharacterized protein DUF1707